MKINKSNLPNDLVAGLTFAVENISQSMAHALLAAVNPVYGLYTLMLATPIGALFTSAIFMNISTTSALAVAADDTIQ
jgi:SulP family sulfate permease